MILVIDVGNTRLKWSWLDGQHLSDEQAVVHRDAKPETWSESLFGGGGAAVAAPRAAGPATPSDASAPKRVLISNVAGDAMARNLQRLCKKTFHVEAQFITPTRSFLELTNGYLNPSLLGADRWLAVIGAWQLAHTALCVVDAGTAVKVDSVNAHGQHLGGLIVPGTHMMRDALLNKTHNIAAAIASSTPSMAGVLANNTVTAVTRGAIFAVAGMADRAAELIEKDTGEHPRLFITGGDAELIAGAMRTRGEIVPDLVLQGLAVIAAQTA